MTSPRRMIACALGLAALLTAALALAQGPGDVRGRADRPVVRKGQGTPESASPSGNGNRRARGAVTPVLLVGLPAIQTELKLSDAQKTAIRDLNAGFDKRRQDAADRLMKAQGGLDQGALVAMIADLRRENEEALARVLYKSQRERLAQVALQLEGPMAITRPEVAARLNLADTQLLQIQALKEQYDALREQLYASSETAFRLRADAPRTPATAVPRSGQSGPKPEESEGDRLTRQSDELRARFVRELEKVLTRRQKTVFNTMLGAPFDLNKVQFRGEQSRRSALPPADAPTILEPITPPNTTAGSKPRD